MSKTNDLQDKIKEIARVCSPGEMAFAEAFARTRISEQLLSHNLDTLKTDYDALFKTMIVLLDASETKELRIHASQFKRFNEEYRLERAWDEETEEVVFRLKTISDD